MHCTYIVFGQLLHATQGKVGNGVKNKTLLAKTRVLTGMADSRIKSAKQPFQNLPKTVSDCFDVYIYIYKDRSPVNKHTVINYDVCKLAFDITHMEISV